MKYCIECKKRIRWWQFWFFVNDNKPLHDNCAEDFRHRMDEESLKIQQQIRRIKELERKELLGS